MIPLSQLPGILALFFAAHSHDLGSPSYPMHCWDAKYQREAASGKYAHVYCRDDRGEVYRDGQRIILRWNGARIEWTSAK